jgi:DNA-binding transcriptional LysR family regulator
MIDAAWLSALHDALVVAQAASVGEAARRLGKTPSAVSQQLRRLEARFGPLFEKRGRGLRLTPAGEAAIAGMTRLFDEAQSLYNLLDELGGGRGTTLRIAASDYLGEALLLPVIRRMVEERVRLHFDLTTTNSFEAGRLVNEGLADVAIVSPAREITAGEVALFQQGFCWIAPRPSGAGRSVRAGSRSRAGRAATIPQRLAREPLLRLSAGSQGRRVLEDLLGRLGITPASTIDVPSVSLMLTWVSRGLGVGLAPSLAVRRVEPGRMLIEPAEVAPLTVRLVLRPALRRTEPVRRFLDELLAEARRIGETA